MHLYHGTGHSLKIAESIKKYGLCPQNSCPLKDIETAKCDPNAIYATPSIVTAANFGTTIYRLPKIPKKCKIVPDPESEKITDEVGSVKIINCECIKPRDKCFLSNRERLFDIDTSRTDRKRWLKKNCKWTPV